MSKCKHLDINKRCDSSSKALCWWSEDKNQILCQASKQYVVGSRVKTEPDFMAVPNTCDVFGNSLTCTHQGTKDTVVSFVTQSERGFVSHGYVGAKKGSRAVIQTGCDLQKCKPVKHQGTLYDHFACQCPKGA